MPQLVYIHGFLSSPLSHKAVLTKRWLAQHHPSIAFHAPALTPYPAETQAKLDSVITQAEDSEIYLIGSSMGGFWCTYLAEAYNLPAVLINPACEPLRLMPGYLNTPLKNYHNDDTYWLKAEHLRELEAVPGHRVTRLGNYWVLMQTGDETLDYTKAVAKYDGCEQLIEPGGDHGFQGFERHLPACIGFFQEFYRT